MLEVTLLKPLPALAGHADLLARKIVPKVESNASYLYIHCMYVVYTF